MPDPYKVLAAKVWFPADGEPDRVREWDVSVVDAAETFVQNDFWVDPHRYPDEQTVHVRDVDGVLHVFTVETHYDVNFIAHRERYEVPRPPGETKGEE
jgi:hypothetical protein